MATSFCLSMGYNFSCMIPRGGFSGVKLSDEDIADFEVLRDVAMATIFRLSTYGVHIGATWRIRLIRPHSAAMRPYVKLL